MRGRTRVAFQFDGSQCRENILHLRTEELGSSTQRVTILPQLALISRDMLLLLDRDAEMSTGHQVVNVPGNLNLSWVRPGDFVDEGIERALSSQHCLCTHGSADLGKQDHVCRLVKSQRGH